MEKVRQYRDFQPGDVIVVGCDPGTGEKNYSVAQFLDRKKLDVPLVYHTSELATTMTNDIYPILEKIFDITGVEPVVAYERGNGGIFELTRLAEMNRKGKFKIFEMQDSEKIGYDTNTATRPKMLMDLKTAIDKQIIKVFDKITIEEMFSFIISNNGKAKAEKNAVDDAVMALAIAWQIHLTTDLPVYDEPVPRQIGGYGKR